MERQGGVPLPPGEVHIHYDPTCVSEEAQQPHAQQVAVFDAKRNDECLNGSALDINKDFVVYAVKNGLIRILHRTSTLKHLVRAHEGKQVTDIKFFMNSDVAGTIGGSLIIWRIYERPQAIAAEMLLEIPETLPSMSRMIWHPFNPNQFWLIHRNQEELSIATLAETTRINTVRRSTNDHAVCTLFSNDVVVEGAVQVVTASDLTDLDWSSRNPAHVLTTHDDGSINLWLVKRDAAQGANGAIPAVCMRTIQDSGPVTRCFFLPHDNVATNYDIPPDATITTAFCTASTGNSCVAIWSPFTELEAPTKFQVFQLDSADPKYNISPVFGPSIFQNDGDPGAFFVLLSDRCEGKLYALSVKTIWGCHQPRRPIVEGFDFIVPFLTKFPTYSWSVAVVPASDLDEDPTATGFDIRFYALQSKMVQDMYIPHYMLSAPTSLWEADTPGLRLEVLDRHTSDRAFQGSDYEDDYELDEDDDDDEEFTTPDPSSLPPPDGVTSPMGGSNPFANWLGSLAAKAPVSALPEPQRVVNAPIPPPPTAPIAKLSLPPGLFPPAQVAMESNSVEISGLLSPMEILSSNSQDLATGNGQKQQQGHKKPKTQRAASPKAKAKDKKGPDFPVGPVPSADGKISILKRDQESLASQPSAPTVETSAPLLSGLEESLKKIIASHFKSQEKVFVAEIQRAVRQEMTQTVLPELSKVVNATVEQSVVRPLQASLEKFSKKAPEVKPNEIIQAVTSGIEEPLKEAFTEVSVDTCLISLLTAFSMLNTSDSRA